MIVSDTDASAIACGELKTSVNDEVATPEAVFVTAVASLPVLPTSATVPVNGPGIGREMVRELVAVPLWLRFVVVSDRYDGTSNAVGITGVRGPSSSAWGFGFFWGVAAVVSVAGLSPGLLRDPRVSAGLS